MDGGGGLWVATNFNVSSRKNLSDLQLPQGNLSVLPELTRLSRSKHTLVNILTIDFTITKIVLLMETKPNQYGIVRILTRVYSQNID